MYFKGPYKAGCGKNITEFEADSLMGMQLQWIEALADVSMQSNI